MDKSVTHSKGLNLLYLKCDFRKLKSGGEITIRFPSYDWWREEIATDVHFDAVNIVTKKGILAQIGLFGF